MLSEKVKGRLRMRIEEYANRTTVSEINPDEPAAVVRAPVHAGGPVFISVDNLPDLSSLPFIPERLREFAFRYATEYMPHSAWAKEFNTTEKRIQAWLRHEGVRAYIAVCRYEQRMYNFAQRVTLQKNVYKTINRILSSKLTGDTIGPVVSMVKFVYEVLHNPSDAHDRAKGVFNVNIGVGQTTSPDTSSPYYSPENPYRLPERDVTPKRIAELEAEILELGILEKALGIPGGNGDDEDS